MSDVQDLFVGHVDSAGIPTVLESLVELDLSFAYAMVTVIDSDPRVARLPSIATLLRAQRKGVSILDRSIVVPRLTLLELVREWDLFNGFDEVWFFESVPLLPRPADVVITADVSMKTRDLGHVAAWMEASGARLGLGDGEGVNYATIDPDIAEHLTSMRFE